MNNKDRVILILGSASDATRAQKLDLSMFYAVVCINHAWQIDARWTHSIYPDDFAIQKRPEIRGNTKRHITSKEYVPIQNTFGGFVYAGGTMAFTAGYWALAALKPSIIAYLGCDMIYSDKQTHFYGSGSADPLRNDPSLRSLEAKSCRLEAHAIYQNTQIINLSQKESSRLTFEKSSFDKLFASNNRKLRSYNSRFFSLAKEKEKSCNYFVEDGKYWKKKHLFSIEEIDTIDSYWLKCFFS